MLNRLIKTEEDHHQALARIERMMEAEKGTDDADELELLTALVEMYEERHFPIGPPDPVEAIRFRMDQQGLKQKDLVPYIGSKSKVSEILSGKRSLTPAMMRALHKGLGIPAEVLLRESGAGFPPHIPDVEWDRFPLQEMVSRGWIPKHPRVGGRAEEVLREFIASAGGAQVLPAAAFRKGGAYRLNEKTDPYALSTWCLRVLGIARRHSLEAGDARSTIRVGFMREVAKLSYFEEGPLLAREYLEKHGIRLVVVPHLKKTYLDGAAMLTPEGVPVIGLSLRYDRLDNFWFCLLHEIAHVARHLSSSSTVIVDDLDLRGLRAGEDRMEEEADRMAGRALIPEKVWRNRESYGKGRARQVGAMAEELKIHPAIVAGRMRFEENNYRILSRYVGRGEVRKHFPEWYEQQ